MKKAFLREILAVLLIFGCFCACGGDDVGDNEGSIADSDLDDTDQIPTITIEKIQSEEGEGGSMEVSWRLNADPAPKTDLVVATGSDWVVIPKDKNHSEIFKQTFWRDALLEIAPLPMVSIVGKGLVVDLETLQEYLPMESRGGHRIPKDFNFPLYTVGDPSFISVEVKLRAHFISAAPAGGAIAPNGSIWVVFDNAPADVTVSAGTVTVAGKIATITGPFAPGPLALTIAWADGSHTLNYVVIAPDIDPPTVTGGTVRNGDRNIDPEVINDDGIIKITFSENVVGNIALQTEGGDDVGWLFDIRGNTGRLLLIKGKEIKNGTTYVIRGKISDAAGNATEISITFVTIGK